RWRCTAAAARHERADCRASQRRSRRGIAMTRWRAITVAALAAVMLSGTAQAERLRLEGEIYAKSSSMLMPPTIDGLWQLNIASLVPDGQPVKQGDVVVAFEAGQVQQQLLQKQSALAEKQSELAKLHIEL